MSPKYNTLSPKLRDNIDTYYYKVNDRSSPEHIVLDLETTIRNRGEDAVGSLKASSFHPDNKIVLYAVSQKSHFGYEYRYPTYTELPEDFWEKMPPVMVGHNIKFDLLYLLRFHKKELLDWVRKGGAIWDTMIVEYLLSGQTVQFAPLGDKGNVKGLARQYGGTNKDDRIKEYWDAGIDTTDIPEHELSEYARNDVWNTQRVFMGQRQRLIEYLNTGQRDHKLLTLVRVQMQALLSTTIMEYNGMHFDMDVCAPIAEEVAKEHDELQERLKVAMCEELKMHETMEPSITPEDCNPNSNKQIAAILFGGEVSHIKSVPKKDEDGNVIKYKTGARAGDIKMVKDKLTIIIDPENAMHNPSLLEKPIPKTPTGEYQVDDTVLKNLPKTLESTSTAFVKNILRYRKLNKDLKTSYVGLMSLVWPPDSCIHGNLNHCATATGRLSSSSPNLQNISGV